VKVEVTGAPHVPPDLPLGVIRSRADTPLDAAVVAEDVRALLDLEAIANVRVESERIPSDRVILRYVLEERRVIGSVTYSWSNPLGYGHWVPLAKGELFDPTRIARTRRDLEIHLETAGHLEARVEERHRQNDHEVNVCFVVQPGPKYLIDRIAFSGNERVSQADLAAQLHTYEHRANEAGQPFRADLLETDLLYVSALYYDRGHLSVKVGPPRTTTTATSATEGKITIDVPIVEGPAYRLGVVRVSGFGSPSEHAEHLKRLGIQHGELFQRGKLLEGIERIRAFERKRGVEVDVTPETKLDSGAGEVDLVFEIARLGAVKK